MCKILTLTGAWNVLEDAVIREVDFDNYSDSIHVWRTSTAMILACVYLTYYK